MFMFRKTPIRVVSMTPVNSLVSSQFRSFQSLGKKSFPVNFSRLSNRARSLQPQRQAFETHRKFATKDSSSPSAFWKSFLGPKPMPERWSAAWYREMVLICTVFAITGSSTMVLVRPAVSKGLGLQGSFKDGPWSFRICSLVIMTPIYATLLLFVGTAFGRHAYFRHFSVKMWSRFGIPPEVIDKSFHETKKTFRKW